MPTLDLGEYRPDLSDLDAGLTRLIKNVMPRADGYGPFPSAEALTEALPAQCRGYFYARNRDNTVTIFAGTIDRLYILDNTDFTWVDASKDSSPYTELSADANWVFAQFNDLVIAVQANIDPQVLDLTDTPEFDDLSGDAPQAAYVSVVNRFVVLSGLAEEPYRVQWSGLNEPANWTAGTNSSDFQDLPDGGIVRPVLGGEFGIILQDQSIRRMTFSPGSETIFDIQRIAKDLGILGPYSACSAGALAFFLTPKGFYQTSGAGDLVPIGEEKINRTFFDEFDGGAQRLLIGAADPNRNVVIWVFKTQSYSGNGFNKALVYNYLLQRWTPVDLEGEYIAPLAAPGLTMEGLDAIAPGAMAVQNATNNGSGLIRITVASTTGLSDGQWKTISGVGGVPNANGTFEIDVINGTTFDLLDSTFSGTYTTGGLVGGNLDLLPFSLDTLSTAALPNLSLCMPDHKIGFFTGFPIEATVETSEQSGDGSRIKVKGFYPITDASQVFGCYGLRETLYADPAYSNESSMNNHGFVPQIRSTRYVRGRMRIPAGLDWSYIRGLRPEVQAEGKN